MVSGLQWLSHNCADRFETLKRILRCAQNDSEGLRAGVPYEVGGMEAGLVGWFGGWLFGLRRRGGLLGAAEGDLVALEDEDELVRAVEAVVPGGLGGSTAGSEDEIVAVEGPCEFLGVGAGAALPDGGAIAAELECFRVGREGHVLAVISVPGTDELGGVLLWRSASGGKE